MAAPKTKITMMTRFNRKGAILRRFGSMKEFQKAAQPWIKGVVPVNVDSLAKIIEGDPCTPEQALAVEQAIDTLLDDPVLVLQRCQTEYLNGANEFTLSLSDMTCLRAALRLDEKD